MVSLLTGEYEKSSFYNLGLVNKKREIRERGEKLLMLEFVAARPQLTGLSTVVLNSSYSLLVFYLLRDQ